MRSFVSVAIDGPSGAGKSTLARRAARRLGYIYVDTGAIYRTVALYCGRKGANLPQEVIACLPEIQVELRYSEAGEQRMILNGEDVSDAIRTPENSMRTSRISAIPEVRAFLLEQQRMLAKTASVIMDGRDIGTVVLPDATVKIFLTATPEARARRRCAELQAGGTDISYETVLQDVQQRDYNDTHRAFAPLTRASDARLVDTTCLDLEQSLERLIQVIQEGVSHG